MADHPDFVKTRLSVPLHDHRLLPELIHLPTEMPVEDVEDKTTIAGTIVGAAEAMELCTSTPKTKGSSQVVGATAAWGHIGGGAQRSLEQV